MFFNIILDDPSHYSSKHHREESESPEASTPKRMKSLKPIPMKKKISLSEYSLLLQEKNRLSDQIERYKAAWMRRSIRNPI